MNRELIRKRLEKTAEPGSVWANANEEERERLIDGFVGDAYQKLHFDDWERHGCTADGAPAEPDEDPFPSTDPSPWGENVVREYEDRWDSE